MNDVIKQLYERKSVRVYTEQPIDEEIVQEILMSAVMAPTAGNQQLYTILRITDKKLLDALAESCDHQPFIAQGKLVLVFCADCLKWYEAFKAAGCEPRDPGPGDLMLAVDDALIAAQNAVVAAQSYGIGSCYIGDIMENAETQREILGLPKYVFPAAMLVFGYPTQQQMEREKPKRVDLKYIVRETAISVWMQMNCVRCCLKTVRARPRVPGSGSSAAVNTIRIFPGKCSGRSGFSWTSSGVNKWLILKRSIISPLAEKSRRWQIMPSTACVSALGSHGLRAISCCLNRQAGTDLCRPMQPVQIIF